MMEMKLFVVVIVSFMALPALTEAYYFGTRRTTGLRPNQDQLVAVAQEALQTINRTISGATEKVVADFQQMLQAADALKQQAFELADQTIEEQLDIVNGQFIEVNASPQCIAQQMSLVRNDAAVYAGNCIIGVSQQITNDTVELLYGMALFNDLIEKAEQDLKDCRYNDFTSDCVKNVINEALELALYLPAQLQLDADKAQVESNGLVAAFQKCIDNTVSIIKEEGSQTSGAFTKCVGKDDGYDYVAFDEDFYLK